MRGTRRSAAISERLRLIAQVQSLVHLGDDLEQIFRTAILNTRRVLPFRRASVVLVNPDRAHFHLHTLYDEARGGFLQAEGAHAIGEGAIGRALRTGEPALAHSMVGTEGIRLTSKQRISAMIVPLRVDGEVIGALNFGDDRPRAYTDEDLQLAVILARQLEISLHYTRLIQTIREQQGLLSHKHEEAERQRNQLRALLDATDSAVLMVGQDRTVLQANRRMADLLGFPHEALLGAPYPRVRPRLARLFPDPETLQAQETALESGRILADRVTLAAPAGSVWQRIVAPVRSADDRPVGHLLLLRDVTREAEAERMKSEFIATVSHELRTPLTAVKTSLSLLLSKAAGPLGEQVERLLEIAVRNIDRLIRLIGDLLDLSRIESGRFELRAEPLEIGDVLRRSVEALGHYADSKGVRVLLREAGAPVWGLGEADRVEQVAVNLLSNAIKFSPAGSNVAAAWGEEGEMVWFEVQDGGPGIPPERRATLFQPFHRGGSGPGHPQEGAGLGLAISSRIVEQLGGRIDVESEVGRGTRFRVWLRRSHRERPARDAEAALPQPHVLLAVGDDDLRGLFEVEFRAAGWSVDAVASAEEAAAVAESNPPTLVCLSLELRDAHGFECLERLRAIPEVTTAPTLMIGPAEDAARATVAGTDAFLRIPTGRGELASAASGLLTAPRRRLVLVVEDEPELRRTTAKIVRHAGHAPLAVANGERALEIARRRVPDLVVTDLRMPRMDGLELLQRMRAEAQLATVPVLVLSGYMDRPTRRALEALSATIIDKPVGAEALAREIARLVPAPGS